MLLYGSFKTPHNITVEYSTGQSIIKTKPNHLQEENSIHFFFKCLTEASYAHRGDICLKNIVK